jgi:ABC-type transport system substrate-binding protein
VAPIFGAGAPAAQGDVNTVVTGGSLIYVEAQAHTNLYPPAGGFYPNGGILNQIADRVTYQNPRTLKLEPWVAESREINPAKTEYTFKIRKGITFSDGTPLDATAVAKNYDTYGLGNVELHQRSCTCGTGIRRRVRQSRGGANSPSANMVKAEETREPFQLRELRRAAETMPANWAPVRISAGRFSLTV